MITPAQVSAIQASLKELELDGWLLYDFRGVNPVTGRVLGVGGMGSRRLFVLIPREGQATAVAHKIELQPVKGFPGQIRAYASWEELHQELGCARPREAARDGGLARRCGALSGPGACRAWSSWSEDLAGLWCPRRRWSAASPRAGVRPRQPIIYMRRKCWPRWPRRNSAGRSLRGEGIRETELQGRVVDGLHQRGLEFDHPPIVAFGANAANPHYEPVQGNRTPC